MLNYVYLIIYQSITSIYLTTTNPTLISIHTTTIRSACDKRSLHNIWVRARVKVRASAPSILVTHPPTPIQILPRMAGALCNPFHHPPLITLSSPFCQVVAVARIPPRTPLSSLAPPLLPLSSPPSRITLLSSSSSSTNPSPHSDQEDSTNLQLLSRCTMSSSSNGNPLKKHHHDHMTTAGQGLTTKDPINLLSSSSSVSQSETDEGTIVGHHVPCYYT